MEMTDPNDDVFSIELLAEELNHPGEHRRKAAREALNALKLLADTRARAEQLPREQVWKHIFDRERLCAEVDGKDRDRRCVAWSVFDALAEVAALRAEDDPTPLPLEHKVASLALWRQTQHMIEEKERELGIAAKPRLPN
jgi:hypothetical protein